VRSKGLGGANQKPFREVPLEKPSTSNDDSFLWFAIAVTVAFLLLWAWK